MATVASLCLAALLQHTKRGSMGAPLLSNIKDRFCPIILHTSEPGKQKSESFMARVDKIRQNKAVHKLCTDFLDLVPFRVYHFNEV